MKTSQHAPQPPVPRPAESGAEQLRRDKEKAARLLARLQWKAELLMLSYARALERRTHNTSSPSGQGAMAGQQAETMFKLDFFEFYTLLERYIADCLALLAFPVPGAALASNFNALRYITNPHLRATRPMAAHSFHANLLSALDDPACPLHPSFASHPPVRIQLGRAKDYRNAWKDADARSSAPSYHGHASPPARLEELQLELMLSMLVAGCEHACAVIQNLTQSHRFKPHANELDVVDMDDAPLEYVDDAMDLD